MIRSSIALLALSLAASGTYAGTPVAPMGKAPVQQPVYEEPVLISYDNVSLYYQYRTADFLGIDVDGHGAGLGLEISPVDHLYFALGGSWTDIDFGVDLDYWQANAGIGGYIPITNNIHFVTEVGVNYANLALADFDDISTDDWGVYVTPHFRAKWGFFETHVGVSYTSNELVLSEWNAFAKFLFEVSPELDLFVAGTYGFEEADGFDDVFGAQAGIRFKF